MEPRTSSLTLFTSTTLFRSSRVFVTGLGLVTPLGCEREAVWERMVAGVSGVAVPRRHAAVRSPTRALGEVAEEDVARLDRKSTRLNSSHGYISYAVCCLQKK